MATEELVERLKPRWVVDETLAVIAKHLRGEGAEHTAQNLIDFIVANNALKSEAVAALTAAEARVAQLETALKPFAEYMGGMDRDNLGNPLPDDAGVGWVYLTQADFRRARTALSQSPDRESGT